MASTLPTEGEAALLLGEVAVEIASINGIAVGDAVDVRYQPAGMEYLPGGPRWRPGVLLSIRGRIVEVDCPASGMLSARRVCASASQMRPAK